jgi:AmiR/NasT family two-component response regulator
MERHGVTADAAFSVLSRVSQAENVKLAEIARRFVETREFPRVPDPENADAMP